MGKPWSRNRNRHSNNRHRSRVNQAAVTAKRQNMRVEGSGANTTQDRGAAQRMPAKRTLHPYENNSHIKRAQDYLKMFNTSWEAQKIVTIPVDDALKTRAELKGLNEKDAKELWKVYDDMDLDRQNWRGLVQERLFGGCIGFGVFKMADPNVAALGQPLRLRDIQKGDFEALNIIDVTQIGLETHGDYDPFSARYDRPADYNIDGHKVDSSRIILMNGNPVVGRQTRGILEGGRVNPLGFSEPVLTALYDILHMSTGAQEGAYHLINLASCLIVEVEHLRSMKATNSKAIEVLEAIIESISIYRGAMVEGKGVKVSQHAASFGAVPELMMMYMQFLSAGSDIPSTRFLGESNGGLSNGNDNGGLENYYNMVRSKVQIGKLRAMQTREFDWIGCSLWGFDRWMIKRQTMEIEYPPLWNETTKDKTDRMGIFVNALSSMLATGAIDGESAINELMAQGFFMTKMEAADALANPPQENSPIDPRRSIAELLGKEPKQEKEVANADNFSESDHPRDTDGKFAKAEGGSESGGAENAGVTSRDEKQKKIDNLKIDFTRDNILPNLNPEDLAALGKEDKPVLLKKNIIDRNAQRHPDIEQEEYAALIGQALYDHDAIIPSKKPDKPNYHHFVKYLEDSNSVVLLELSSEKENHEIVHVIKMNGQGLKRL